MLRRYFCAALLLAGVAGCRHDAIEKNVPSSVTLSSPKFQSGQAIPAAYTCHGANISPPLEWTSLPPGTKSLALLVVDEDSLFGAYVHWVVYNLPPQPSALPENLPHQDALANGTRQGVNGGGATGYTGPCPPGASPHHYVFTLYALNDAIALPQGAGKSQVLKSVEGHVLAVGRLTGTYQHP